MLWFLLLAKNRKLIMTISILIILMIQLSFMVKFIEGNICLKIIYFGIIN